MDKAPARPPDFLLEDLSVYIDEGLLVGARGTTRLAPRVAAVLDELARADGEVLSRDQILSAAWKNTVVTDDALNRCIYQLRTELPPLLDIPADQPVIETLPKRGYRLLLAVSRPTGASPPGEEALRGGRARMIIIGAALVLVAVSLVLWNTTNWRSDPGAIRSVAVLPFLNLTGDNSLQYLADGFSEQLSHALAGVEGLRVSARTSAFYFRDQVVTVPEIARRLDVGVIIEGSIRQEGSRMRVTVQVIRQDGFHLWSGEFDRPLATTVTTQSEISQLVLQALGLEAPPDLEDLAPPSQNFAAYDAYLRGRYALISRDYNEAIGHFQDAIDRDEQYALAYSGIADAHSFMRFNQLLSADEIREPVEAAIDRALAIAPDLAEGHASRGLYLFALNRYAEAEPHLRRASTLNPNYLNARNWLALTLVHQNRFAEATEVYRQAQTLDPLDHGVNRNLGANLLLTGNPDEGFGYLERVQELRPNELLTYQMLGHWYLMYGQPETAREWARRGLEVHPRDPRLISLEGQSYVVEGHWELAMSQAQQAMELNPDDTVSLDLLLIASHGRGGPAELEAALATYGIQNAAVFGWSRTVLRWQMIAALSRGKVNQVLELARNAPENDMVCGVFGAPGPLMYQALAIRQSGDLEAARSIADQCVADAERVIENGGRYSALQLRLAASQLLAGRHAEAGVALGHAIELGWAAGHLLELDPLWEDALRLDEFASLIAPKG
ncbi:MAG: tetratricopeptide repeat protein [Xanthomonadales bacterium]|nr:tetratricopeptide repeat protein [Xanthomonadales bacterium]